MNGSFLGHSTIGALGLLLVLGWATTGSATPMLFASNPGDDSPSGVLDLDTSGDERAVRIWLDTEELVFQFLISLVADSGIELVEFTPNPAFGDLDAVDLTPGDGGTVTYVGGDLRDGIDSLVEIGTLLIRSHTPGSTLRLDQRAGSAPPSYVDAAFESRQLVTPQGLAIVVPEPGAGLLILIGMVGIAAGRRFA